MSTLLDLPQIKKAGSIVRLKLAEDLLNSIGDLDISKEFKSELIRRAEELAANPKSGRSWSKVKAGRRQ